MYGIYQGPALKLEKSQVSPSTTKVILLAMLGILSGCLIWSTCSSRTEHPIRSEGVHSYGSGETGRNEIECEPECTG